MKAQKTVSRITTVLKLSKKDLIFVITILLMIVGWFVHSSINKEVEKITVIKKTIYKNESYIKNLPEQLDSGFATINEKMKFGFNIIRSEFKREIKRAEKRININTNLKLESIIEFIPDINNRESNILKRLINTESRVIEDFEPFEPFILNENETCYLPNENIYIENESLETEIKPKKRNLFKRIFTKK